MISVMILCMRQSTNEYINKCMPTFTGIHVFRLGLVHQNAAWDFFFLQATL
jgi:hypothetical protein